MTFTDFDSTCWTVTLRVIIECCQINEWYQITKVGAPETNIGGNLLSVDLFQVNVNLGLLYQLFYYLFTLYSVSIIKYKSVLNSNLLTMLV